MTPAAALDGPGLSTGDDHEVVVRLATGDDLDGVVAVGRTAWQENSASFIPSDLLELLLAKWWTKDANVSAIRAGRTFVAEVDGDIVGMASYGVNDGRLVIWKIYVLPRAQRLGVGGRLLEAVYDRARDGHDCVYLSVTAGNTKGTGFALSHGYVEDQREAQSGMPDVVWMRHDFLPGDGGGSVIEEQR